MNNLKRLIWCALLFGIQALYFPLNRFLQGGIEFKTALDDYVPIWSVWVIPYALVCIWWIVAYLWAARVWRRIVYMKPFLLPQRFCPDDFYCVSHVRRASPVAGRELANATLELDLCQGLYV